MRKVIITFSVLVTLACTVHAGGDRSIIVDGPVDLWADQSVTSSGVTAATVLGIGKASEILVEYWITGTAAGAEVVFDPLFSSRGGNNIGYAVGAQAQDYIKIEGYEPQTGVASIALSGIALGAHSCTMHVSASAGTSKVTASFTVR